VRPRGAEVIAEAWSGPRPTPHAPLVRLLHALSMPSERACGEGEPRDGSGDELPQDSPAGFADRRIDGLVACGAPERRHWPLKEEVAKDCRVCIEKMLRGLAHEGEVYTFLSESRDHGEVIRRRSPQGVGSRVDDAVETHERNSLGCADANGFNVQMFAQPCQVRAVVARAAVVFGQRNDRGARVSVCVVHGRCEKIARIDSTATQHPNRTRAPGLPRHRGSELFSHELGKIAFAHLELGLHDNLSAGNVHISARAYFDRGIRLHTADPVEGQRTPAPRKCRIERGQQVIDVEFELTSKQSGEGQEPTASNRRAVMPHPKQRPSAKPAPRHPQPSVGPRDHCEVPSQLGAPRCVKR